MSLAGLILTDDDNGSDRDPACALLPIAGRPLLEYQVRTVRACGAGHIIVLVDRVLPGVVALFDRLRAEGIEVDIARSARDAADRIHPEEQVLVLTSGAVAPAGLLETLAGTGHASILSVADGKETEHLERIDGTTRWTGIALIDGQIVRETAQMLGSWVLGPTLLRAALQKGVRTEPAGGTVLVRNAEDARQASLGLLTQGEAEGGFVARKIMQPIARAILPYIAARNLSFEAITAVPFVLLALAIVAALSGWLATGLTVVLLASFVRVLGSGLEVAVWRPGAKRTFYKSAELAAFIVILLAAGWNLSFGGENWGAIAIAAWAGVALLLQPKTDPKPLWAADAEGGAIVLLIALVAGQPLAGIGVILAGAVVTQFLLVRRLNGFIST